MKRTIIIVISFAVIVAMAYGIMKFLVAQKEMPSMRKAPELVRYVKTQDVVYGNVFTEVVGKGRVVALASVDIIAEGSGKFPKADGRNFFVISRASLFECAAILDIQNDYGKITQDEFDFLCLKADELSRMLYSMIKNLST